MMNYDCVLSVMFLPTFNCNIYIFHYLRFLFLKKHKRYKFFFFCYYTI